MLPAFLAQHEQRNIPHIAKRINEGKMVSCGFYMASIAFYNTLDDVGLRFFECSSCERIWFLGNDKDDRSYIKKEEHPFFDFDYFSCVPPKGSDTGKVLPLNRKIKIFRFLCSCGYFFISAEASSPEEYLIIPDKLLDDFACRLDEKKLDGSSFLGEAHRLGRSMIICPKCGRHWIYASDSKNYTSYIEEDIP